MKGKIATLSEQAATYAKETITGLQSAVEWAERVGVDKRKAQRWAKGECLDFEALELIAKSKQKRFELTVKSIDQRQFRAILKPSSLKKSKVPDEQILAWFSEGYGTGQIAEKAGLTHQRISQRLQKLLRVKRIPRQKVRPPKPPKPPKPWEESHTLILKLADEMPNASYKELAEVIGVHYATIRRVLAKKFGPRPNYSRRSGNRLTGKNKPSITPAKHLLPP